MNAELMALLPDASDLGPDYTVAVDDGQDDDSFDEAFDDALADACPAAAQLDVDQPGEVAQSYERSDGPAVEVKVAPADAGWSEPDLEAAIDALDSCEDFSFTHEAVTVELSLSAQRSDEFGEFGMRTYATMILDADNLPEPIRVRVEGVEFVAEGVGVSISASDGVDDQAGVVKTGDYSLIEPLATRIEGQLGFVDATTTTTTAPSPATTTTPPTTEPMATTIPVTAPPATAPPTTSAATPLPGSQCDLGSHPNCIDPDGDGVGTFLLFGADCMQSFADSPGLCTDLDGDGRAGYPDGG